MKSADKMGGNLIGKPDNCYLWSITDRYGFRKGCGVWQISCYLEMLKAPAFLASSAGEAVSQDVWQHP